MVLRYEQDRVDSAYIILVRKYFRRHALSILRSWIMRCIGLAQHFVLGRSMAVLTFRFHLPECSYSTLAL
jgi:hypothetical protein